MKRFWDKLTNAQRKNSSALVVGLDPNLRMLPVGFDRSPTGVQEFLLQIISATAHLVCAYKPNIAFFLSLGTEGMEILRRIIIRIPVDIPVILDGKFGDVGHTAQRYAHFAGDVVGVDAVTANPYIGWDAIKPFVESELGVFLLCATSNPSYGDVQKMKMGGHFLYESMAVLCGQWMNRHDARFGLVVGATHPELFDDIRELAPGAPFLVPGIGAQGGELEHSVRASVTVDGIPPLVVSARSILYASDGADFAKKARNAADELRKKINKAGGFFGE